MGEERGTGCGGGLVVAARAGRCAVGAASRVPASRMAAYNWAVDNQFTRVCEL